MDILHIFLSTFNKGGWLMWCIFGVSLVAWFIGVEKALSLRRFHRSRRIFLSRVHRALKGEGTDRSTGNKEYDILLSRVGLCAAGKLCGARGHMREFLLCTVPSLERSFSTMSAWISVAPLLGLLGTVMGMIETFRVITDFGVGNPNLTAEGISIALLTTQAGLTVAFPALIFHNFLMNKKNNLVNNLIKDCETVVTQLTAKR